MTGRPLFQIPRPSTAIQAIIATNIVVMLLSAAIGPNLGGRPLVSWLALSQDGLFAGYGLGLLRLLTHQFAHAGLWHIAFNLLVFWIFARITEQDTGDRGLWHLYLVGGVLGGVFQLLLHIVTGAPSDVQVLGASGAVYAVLIYAARMAPRMEILLFLVLPIQLRWLALFLVLIGVLETFEELHGSVSGTAHAAHLGGAFYGWLAFDRFRAFYLRQQYRPASWLPWLERWRARRVERRAGDLQQTLDSLLEKVHREGMSALTPAERRNLERVSRELKRK